MFWQGFDEQIALGECGHQAFVLELQFGSAAVSEFQTVVDEAACFLGFCLNEERSFYILYAMQQGRRLCIGNIAHEPLFYPLFLLVLDRLLHIFLLTRKTDRIIRLPFIIIASLHKDYLLLLNLLLSLHMLNYINNCVLSCRWVERKEWNLL